jgi:small subunit ribosomal protein S21
MTQITPRRNKKTNQLEGFDSMLRRFRKACDRKGIVKEVRERKYYEKPNDTRNQKNQELKRKKKLELKRRQNSNYRKIR